MDHIPDDLLELQARFDQWRANRKYNREPIPDQLRDAALETRRLFLIATFFEPADTDRSCFTFFPVIQ